MGNLEISEYENIAVIGYHCKFPKSDNAEQYWSNLINCKNCIVEIPKERWDDCNTSCKYGGFISDVDKFDPLLFNISPIEAQQMDPQLRLVIESVWSTLENGGYGNHRNSPQNKIGLYVGAMWNDYALHVNEKGFLQNRYCGGGSLSWELANRTSFVMNFNGPSIAVDTGCSSSSLAVHIACRSLHEKECDLAVAAGVNLILHPSRYIYLAKEGLLSSVKEKNIFEPDSKGYIPGEGVGSILLKPLHKAEKDNDHIYAIIKASGTNHSGGGFFYKVPSSDAQAELIKGVYTKANIDPRTISYIEMSAFGSEMVDTAEFIGLKKAFQYFTSDKNFCAIGSSKPSLGHIESASGISQIIKIILQFENKQIVPSKFSKKNPIEEDIEDSPFIMQKELSNWEAFPRVAGINSFGAGGTNVHIILEEYNNDSNKCENIEENISETLIVLSANDKESLRRNAENIKVFIDTLNNRKISPDLENVAYTLQIGREVMQERLAIISDSFKDVSKKIESFLNGNNTDNLYTGTALSNLKEGEEVGWIENASLKELAFNWCQGMKVNFELLNKNNNKFRIPLPSYSFRRDKYWITQNNDLDRNVESNSVQYDMKINADTSADKLKRKLINYFKFLLSKKIKLSIQNISENELFSRFGITSLMIKELNTELEAEFGELPKTLFFEFQTINQLTDYLIKSRRDKLTGVFKIEFEKHDSSAIEDTVCVNSPFYQRYRPEAPIAGPCDVAIIGISGKYPKSNTLDDYWNNLKLKKDCISEIPEDRWDLHKWYDENPDNSQKSYSKWGGFLENIDIFDPTLFEINPREAEMMDPQERLFLQIAWETIEDAGYSYKDLSWLPESNPVRTGVFVGIMWTEYQLFGIEEIAKGNFVTPSSALYTIPNRVSYCLNFSGPSIAVDTACSSSLVAIHLACQSLMLGECTTAIAGGVNLSLHFSKYLYLSQKKFYSPVGRCKSFGHHGDGFVSGEGIGAVLLKPLKNAVADGDHICGVIKGTAVNHGGKTNGYTVPSPVAQSEVITEALKHANIDPITINYIEAHGTGTSLGDPIEIEGLSKCFRKYTGNKQFCSIGSVKSNIGHLEAASGIAGLTKVLLQMKFKKILPSLHSEELNKNINFSTSPFIVQQEVADWDNVILKDNGIESKCPRRAGISAFGSGGANAHIVVEEYENAKLKNISNSSYLIVLSAQDDERLREYVKKIIFFLNKSQSFKKINCINENNFISLIQRNIRKEISDIGGTEDIAIDISKDYAEYNLEYTDFHRLANAINKRYSINIVFDDVAQHSSVELLSRFLCSEYREILEKYHVEECEQNIESETNHLADIAYTLQVGRYAMEERLALIVSNEDELKIKLNAFLDGKPDIDNLYLSNTRRNLTKELLTGSKEGDESIKIVLNNRDLIKIAQLWTSGIEIDWKLLYQSNKYNRISLPTYPFAKEKYWIPQLINEEFSLHNKYLNEKQYHPLLHRNVSTLAEQKFVSIFNGDEFYIKDHIIDNVKLLPGVACIELARVAGEIAGEKDVKKLFDITWIKPVFVEEDSVELYIGLYPFHDYIDFKIYTRGNDNERVNHVSGKLDFNDQIDNIFSDSIDINSIKNQCSIFISGEDCYEIFKKNGLQYGPTFQTIKELYCNSNEALALLELPPECIEEFDSFLLHPSILDGAFQSTVAYISSFDKNLNKLYVPFNVEKVDIIQKPGKLCYSYVQQKVNYLNSDNNIKIFNVILLDEAGKISVNINKLSLKQLQQNNCVLNSIFINKKNDVIYFINEWKKTQLNLQSSNKKLFDNILLFDNGENVKKYLSSNSNVILVKSGNEFLKIRKNFYQINPENIDDYRNLILDLKHNGIMPHKIVHLWSKNSVGKNDVNIDVQLKYGYYSLFYISQVLLEGKITKKIQLLYLFEDMGNMNISSFYGTSGFAKTIRRENPLLLYKTISLASETKIKNTTIRPDQIVNIILNEFRSKDESEIEIRYRNNQRYVRRLTETDISDGKENISQNLLREDGVYLVTGGLGGLGLIFAKYLAKKIKCQIILTGRSVLTSEKSNEILELEKLGTEVLYIEADVSNIEDVNRLFKKIKTKYNAIHGIIHSAGVTKDSFIIKKTNDEIESVLAPKVFGTLNLHAVLGDDNIDFFVLFSSTAAVLGNQGQCDYSFGNCFMDNFAKWREESVRQKQCYGRTISINWPLWKEGGMRVDNVTQDMLKETIGMKPLTTVNGLKAFESILINDANQITIIEGDTNKIRNYVGVKVNNELFQTPVSNKESFLNIPKNDTIKCHTELFLLNIVSEATKLQVKKMKPSDSFEKYGIDSLMVMTLTRKLEDYFGQLPKTLFFEYNNIEELSEYFVENHFDKLTNIIKIASSPTEEKIKLTTNINRLSSYRTQAVKIPTKDNKHSGKEDIAIIGVSGRYPDADTLYRFWENLKNGKDSITEVPPERWDYNDHFSSDKFSTGTTYTKWGGFLKDIDKFDPLFFKISPKEASLMDPQVRLMLEIVWETIEDAGYKKSNFEGLKVGVFTGVMWGQFQLYQSEIEKGISIPCESSYASIANRISYFYDFKGPSFSVDSMCSSSLIAIHLACENIHNGNATLAIAGGVNLSLHPDKYKIISIKKYASTDGKCRSFGEGGDGYVPGEGVGAILLKPVSKAISDGDNIYGVIKGTSINHDGKTNNYTVPNPVAQQNLILNALKKANISPETISYIEAHGTGTSLGDPIEINGLKRAFEKYTLKKQFCSIGSVKSNIGHLEAASGVAGITKVLLQMKNKQLVPSLHSQNLNPNIDFEGSPFVVVQALKNWRRPQTNCIEKTTPRRAGISSFGAGGSNAHIIVEEYSGTLQNKVAFQDEEYIFILSAINEERMKEYSKRIRKFLEKYKNAEISFFRNFIYTLQVGRQEMEERLAIVVSEINELVKVLDEFITGSVNFKGLYKSNIKKIEINPETWIVGDDGKKLINNLIVEKNNHKIARLWTYGANIDWMLFYKKNRPNRISLPTYPFAKEQCWPSQPVIKCNSIGNNWGLVSPLHSLVDSNESNLKEQKFKKQFNGEEFYLNDHVINGRKILPGAVYLEMVRASGEIAIDTTIKKIKDVVLSNPLYVNGKHHDVYIKFIPKNEDINFEVFSFIEGKSKILHSNGKLIYDTEKLDKYENVDIDSITKRCPSSIEGYEFYKRFEKIEFEYGSTFQSVQQIHWNSKEALSHIRLPLECQDKYGDFVLNPSLIDGVFQSAIVLTDDLNNLFTATYLPFAVDEIDIPNLLPKEFYAHVEQCYTKIKDSKILKRFNINLIDTDGNSFAKIKEYILRLSGNKPIVSAKNEKDMHNEIMYYNSLWEKSEISDANMKQKHNKDEAILIFENNNDVTDGQDKRVILIKSGASYEELGNETYQINYSNENDYRKLFASLKRKKIILRRIAFLASDFKPNVQDNTSIIVKVNETIYPIFFLTKSLMLEDYQNKLEILYVYSSDGNIGQPQHSAVIGFAKTLKIENPKYTCKTINYISNSHELLPTLFSEFNSNIESVIEILYKDNARYIKQFRKIDCVNSSKPFIKKNGVYLITGGAGGLGLIFAKYFATQEKCKLILTGRSKLDTFNKLKIKEIEKLGSEVLYIPSDVADRNNVKDLIFKIKEKYNNLDGIVHSAGVTSDSYILKKSKEEIESVIASKVHGTIHLDEVTKHEKIAFFILFSSMSSVVGNIGQCDYSYGNKFMDDYAEMREELRRNKKRKGKTLSISWPLWEDGGMDIDEAYKLVQKEKLGVVPLDTVGGLNAFKQGIVLDGSQLIVAKGELDKFQQIIKIINTQHKLINLDEKADIKINNNTNSTAQKISHLKIEVDNYLKRILSKEIKLDIDKIHSTEALENYGIDSVMIISLTKELEHHFGELPKTLFFEHQNIGELTEYFIKWHQQKLNTLLGLSTSVQPVKLKESINYKTKGFHYNNERFIKSNDMINKGEDIAIIGLSGRYPLADNIDEYWENLKNGKDCITEIPEDRWDYRQYFKDGKTNKNKWGGFINGVDEFDPMFFKITPKDARQMDPQQRLFLEIVYLAIEDAGYTKNNINCGSAERDIGVFVGTMWGEYQLFGLDKALNGNGVKVNSPYWAIANRISYFFNFSGPSLTIDTACSSSLTAIHMASKAIKTGECSIAIAGGINLSLHPAKYIALEQDKFLSSDGRCRSFGEGGDGYVPGEGVGAVVLKPLSKAEEDGDYIYSIIKGSSINHGGKTNAFTVPNPKAHYSLIVKAFEDANISPNDISYLEAHGTGTSLGDPIEINGLTNAFSTYSDRKQYCSIGSVKSNIGHLEAAAGIAALTKVILQMKNKKLVASLNSDQINSNINFAVTPFYLQRTYQDWQKPKIEKDGILKEVPRIAAISSFGAGGSNAHIIVKEYDKRKYSNENNHPKIIVLSSKEEYCLKQSASNLKKHLELSENRKNLHSLQDIAYTLQVGREHFNKRLAIIATTTKELIIKLEKFLSTDFLTKGTNDIFCSNNDLLKLSNNVDISIDQSEEAMKFIISLFRSKSFTKIASFWVMGSNINWDKLYKDNGIECKRVPLPKSPFAKKKFWIKIDNDESNLIKSKTSESKYLHPLLYEIKPSLNDTRVITCFKSFDKFIGDHVVDGKLIIPGVCQLEMVRAAASLINNTPIASIRRVRWLRPLIYGNHQLDIETKFFVNNDAVEFRLMLGNTIYSKGKIVFDEDKSEKIRKYKIDDIKAKFKNKVGKIEIYNIFKKKKLVYGTTFKGLQTLWYSKEESLGKINLVKINLINFKEYVLHPTIMDASLQSTIGIGFNKELKVDKYLNIPFSANKITIYQNNSSHKVCYAYSRKVPKKSKNNMEYFNINILDKNGNTMIFIESFCVKKVSSVSSKEK